MPTIKPSMPHTNKLPSDDDRPVGAAGFRAGQHENNLHHGCMAHCESAYSDERKRVGEVAEQYLKQFEKIPGPQTCPCLPA